MFFHGFYIMINENLLKFAFFNGIFLQLHFLSAPSEFFNAVRDCAELRLTRYRVDQQ
jgi:hypothetical protein